jgi:hypothetical protein
MFASFIFARKKIQTRDRFVEAVRQWALQTGRPLTGDRDVTIHFGTVILILDSVLLL